MNFCDSPSRLLITGLCPIAPLRAGGRHASLRGMRAFAFLAALAALPAHAAEITPEGLTDLPAADVVVLGEVHDNPAHHENQRAALAALQPKAVVFEMLTPEQAALITPETRDDKAALEQALDWAQSGWPDFAMYHPLMVASAAQIFGAALPPGEVRRAFGEGAATVFGDQAPAYGLDQPLPEDMQTEREELQFAAHCEAMPMDMMSGMVEAQRLRDAAFARAVVQAHAAIGGPVAVITGNGHARKDWGLPAALAKAAPDLSLISVGQFEEGGEDSAEGDEEPTAFDLWLVTEAAEREDPCAVFQKD